MNEQFKVGDRVRTDSEAYGTQFGTVVAWPFRRQQGDEVAVHFDAMGEGQAVNVYVQFLTLA